MITLAILNEKGGCGKTTLAVTLAAGLAARGQRVLLVDADAQGHATRALGLAKYPGLYELLVREAGYEDVMKAVPAPRYGGQGLSSLYIIGSNIETINIALNISEALILVRTLEPLHESFDWCLIDTAPTPSLLHGAIYLAADWMLYPTLCELWSFDGLAESMAHQEAFKKRLVKPVQVAGIVPMRFRANTLEHTENLQKLRDKLGDRVWNPVPERIVWAEAATFMLPVMVHAPSSEAAGDAWELVDRVEGLSNGKPTR